MRPQEALNNVVKKELEETFGAGLAARIIFSAISATGAPIIDITKEKYLEVIEHICNDERVRGLWGDFGAQSKFTLWKELVSN